MSNELETSGSGQVSRRPTRDASPQAGTALPSVNAMEYSGEIERVIAERLSSTLEWSSALSFPLDRSLIELFCRVDTLRTDASPYVLQFVAPSARAGTSTIAAGFAMVAAVVTHKPVLLLRVISSQTSPPSVIRVLADGGGLHEAIEVISQAPGLYRGCLADNLMVLTRTAGNLKEVLDLMRERFSAVIVDGPAVEDNEASLVLSRYCDSTAVVVRAEHSQRAAVRRAVGQIRSHGGDVLGTVLNGQKRYLPDWLDRRLD